jgi:hypothetical protein
VGVPRAFGLEVGNGVVGVGCVTVVEQGVEHGRARPTAEDAGDEQDDAGPAEP